MKLLILDVDGVLTDGRKYYGIDGMPFAKTYCDKDFTAIKFIRAAGIKVCFLSGDNNINSLVAKNRNIDFYSARGKDKAEFLEKFVKIYNVDIKEMCYVGDDLFDASIMKLVGYKFCPNDASRFIKDICGSQNIVDRPAGKNVIAELVNILLERKLITVPSFKQIEELDKHERF